MTLWKSLWYLTNSLIRYFQRMTSVSPLPSYMSGYLHQLGGQASGVYRSASDYKHKPFEHWHLWRLKSYCSYVSLPRLVETRRPPPPSPDSVMPPAGAIKHKPAPNVPNGDLQHRISCKVASEHVMLCNLRTGLFQRISPINEAYVRRRDKIKNRISSQRVSLVGRAPPAQARRRGQQPAKIVPTHTTQAEKTVPTHTIQPTQPTTLHLTRHQERRTQIPIKSVPLLPPPSNSFKIEQWTEKLLEEARSSYNHLKLIWIFWIP